MFAQLVVLHEVLLVFEQHIQRGQPFVDTFKVRLHLFDMFKGQLGIAQLSYFHATHAYFVPGIRIGGIL